MDVNWLVTRYITALPPSGKLGLILSILYNVKELTPYVSTSRIP
ncbi:hypothetical protein SRDD_33590 [Serratia sp. DD3]|nr:hypothetical protein SRDD_33590 [Serratia sp. DD3]